MRINGRRFLVSPLTVGLLGLTLAAACTPSSGPASPAGDPGQGLAGPVQLRFATFTEGTAWYGYGASISELLRPLLPAGSSLDVLPLAGGVANPQLLAMGKADFAINFAINTRWAREGRVVYESEMEDLRGLVGGFDVYHLLAVARHDLPIQSLVEVKEQKMPLRLYTITVGGQGERATQMLLEAYGMSYEDIEAWGGQVHHTSFDVIKTAFQDGRADLLVHGTPEGHPSVTEISVMSSVKFLSLSEEITASLGDAYGMDATRLPAESFRGQEQEVQTVGWSVTLDATTRMPEDVAYLITKTVLEGKDQLGMAHKSLKEFDPTQAAHTVGVPLHSGAERYYREAGLLD